MSYDLYVHEKTIPDDQLYETCDHDWHWLATSPRGKYFHYTYNLSRFFTQYKVNPKRDLHGLTAKECAHRIDIALHDIHRSTDIRMLEHLYNPDNRYGSVGGAIGWLRDIREYCANHPDFMVSELS